MYAEKSISMIFFLWFQAADQIKGLYNLFVKVDASQVEINPFGETPDGRGKEIKSIYVFNTDLSVKIFKVKWLALMLTNIKWTYF